MKIKGEFYPQVMRIACHEVQVAFNCDPEVLRFFTDRFVLRGLQQDLAIQIFEGEAEEWSRTEKIWRETEARERETNRFMH